MEKKRVAQEAERLVEQKVAAKEKIEKRFARTGYPFPNNPTDSFGKPRASIASRDTSSEPAAAGANTNGGDEKSDVQRAVINREYLLSNKIKQTSYSESAYYQDEDPKPGSILQAIDEPELPQNFELPKPDQSDLPPKPFLLPRVDDEKAEKPKARKLDLKNPISTFMPTMPNNNLGQLTLEKVFASVVQFYPEIEAALGQMAEAQGKALASQGNFDSVFAAHSISQPLGFYQTYRNGLGVTQPLFSGGEVYGTWRIGDGNFEPWFGERETNEAGELKFGFSIPLLKDVEIDKRRAGLFKAELNVSQVENEIQARMLSIERAAAGSFWLWVASSELVRIQNDLLNLAKGRVDGINERIKVEDLPELARINNDQFIRKRTNDLFKANREREKSSIKLSIFFRDQAGRPTVVGKDTTAPAFPTPLFVTPNDLEQRIEFATANRPELQELMAMRQQAQVDLQQARNLTLPKIDIKGFAGQDLGGETSSKGDKTPFEFNFGILGEVPIQRRQGLGKIDAAQGKIASIDAKAKLVRDKIKAEVQDTASAVNAAVQQFEQSEENLKLTRESLRLGRIAFDSGNINLIELNIYETAVATAELELLDAKLKYVISIINLDTATRNRAFVNFNLNANRP